MAEPSAQERKARQGGTSGPQDVLNDGGGSVLGLSGSGVEGKPALVRKTQSGQEIDAWNTANIRLDVAKLEKALATVKTDSNYELVSFIRAIEYQGFDREFYVKHALSKMSVSVFVRFAIIGAIRGSKFRKITETCEQMPQDLTTAFTTCSFIEATPKKRTDLTILRNTASIPHWCAYWMYRAGTTKKVPDSVCEACIQFPGAASLPMSRQVRLQHLDFSMKFSSLLPGGRFNLNIYMTAYNNPIPIEAIPDEILGVLKVGSASESYTLTDEDVEVYSRAVIGPRRPAA